MMSVSEPILIGVESEKSNLAGNCRRLWQVSAAHRRTARSQAEAAGYGLLLRCDALSGELEYISSVEIEKPLRRLPDAVCAAIPGPAIRRSRIAATSEASTIPCATATRRGSRTPIWSTPIALTSKNSPCHSPPDHGDLKFTTSFRSVERDGVLQTSCRSIRI